MQMSSHFRGAGVVCADELSLQEAGVVCVGCVFILGRLEQCVQMYLFQKAGVVCLDVSSFQGGWNSGLPLYCREARIVASTLAYKLARKFLNVV